MDLAKCGGTRRLEIWHPYAVLHYLKKPVDLLICRRRFRHVAWLPVSFSRRFTMGMNESLSDLRH